MSEIMGQYLLCMMKISRIGRSQLKGWNPHLFLQS